MTMVHDADHIHVLKASEEIVGQLQPCIKEKGTNRILIGRHRKGGNPEWWTIEKEVKDDLHRELIIIHGQVQRGLSDEEARMRIQRIAQILTMQKSVEEKDVCSYIVRNKLLPWSQPYIDRLLDKRYKQNYPVHRKPKRNIINTGFNNELAETQAKEVKTALTDISRTVETPEATFPFNDCKCKTCPHRSDCY